MRGFSAPAGSCLDEIRPQSKSWQHAQFNNRINICAPGLGSIDPQGCMEEEDGSSSGSNCLNTRRMSSSSSYTTPTLLPQHLTRKVIARLPYPDIFQARCLSKSWRDLLSSPSADPILQDFQAEVASVSKRWPTFTPVVLHDGALFGYDPKGQMWTCLSLVGYSSPLGSMLSRTKDINGYIVKPRDEYKTVKTQCAGPMVCQFRSKYRNEEFDWGRQRVMVTNTITGSSKALNPPPLMKRGWWWVEGHVFHAFPDGFHIVLLYTNKDVLHFQVAFQVFDSRQVCWTTHFVEEPFITFSRGMDRNVRSSRLICCPRLVDSKVVLFACECSHPLIGRYDCSTKLWTYTAIRSNISRIVPNPCVAQFALLACGSLLIFICGLHLDFQGLTVKLFKFDQSSARIVPLYEGQKLRPHSGLGVHCCSTDGERIYLGIGTVDGWLSAIYCYDLASGEWSLLPTDFGSSGGELDMEVDSKFRWLQGSYSPGINPFVNPILFPSQNGIFVDLPIYPE